MKGLTDFQQLVFDMRKTQQAYFKTRRKEYLQQSKQLESKVDKALLDKINNHYNPKLFDS